MEMLEAEIVSLEESIKEKVGILENALEVTDRISKRVISNEEKYESSAYSSWKDGVAITSLETLKMDVEALGLDSSIVAMESADGDLLKLSIESDKNILEKAWDAIKKFISGIWNAIAKLFKQIMKWLGLSGDKIDSSVSNIEQTIKDVPELMLNIDTLDKTKLNKLRNSLLPEIARTAVGHNFTNLQFFTIIDLLDDHVDCLYNGVFDELDKSLLNKNEPIISNSDVFAIGLNTVTEDKVNILNLKGKVFMPYYVDFTTSTQYMKVLLIKESDNKKLHGMPAAIKVNFRKGYINDVIEISKSKFGTVGDKNLRSIIRSVKQSTVKDSKDIDAKIKDLHKKVTDKSNIVAKLQAREGDAADKERVLNRQKYARMLSTAFNIILNDIGKDIITVNKIAINYITLIEDGLDKKYKKKEDKK